MPDKPRKKQTNQSSLKVSYLGLSSLFGRVTTNLLKQSPCIHKLTLYDDNRPPQATEHPNVFFGRDSIQDAIKDVNIVVIGDEGSDVREEDRLRFIGPKIVRYIEAIIKFCPNAIVIVAASPLNILFPLIGNFLGPDWQDRLLGTTSVDTLRASRTLDGLLNDPQGQTHILPVIGGASYSTRVPLFSHVCPQVTVSDDLRDKIREKMQLFDGSESQDMDAIERAYSTVRFIHSVLTGITRDTSVPEIAMTKTSRIPQTNYFSLPILIGQKGIERAADLPKLDAFEEKLFFEAARKLSEDSQKAVLLSKQLTSKDDENSNKHLHPELQNKSFPKAEDKNLASESSLKNLIRDTRPFYRGKPKKIQKFSRNAYLELPCVEGTSVSSSYGVSRKPFENSHQKGRRHDISKTNGEMAEDEPVSEDSELLNKDVTDPLSSLKFVNVGIQQKDVPVGESTESEFSETLEADVEEHLNSLKQSKQPRNLNSQSENLTGSEVGVEGRNELESWDRSNLSVMSSSDELDSRSEPAEPSQNTAAIQTTPFKRMNEAIGHSKPVKFGINSATSTESQNVPSVPSKSSPSARIDSSIASTVRSSAKELDLAQLEHQDTTKELRPDDTVSKSNQNAKLHREVQNPNWTMTNDAEKEVLRTEGGANNIGNRSQNANITEQDDAKRERRPRDNELANSAGAQTTNASPSMTAAVLKITRLEDDPANSATGIETVNPEMAADAKKELRHRKNPVYKSGSPNLKKKSIKQARKKVATANVRRKVNARVVKSFAPGSSGDQMSKSQIMMLKRKQKNEEKARNEKPQQMVGEDGDAAELKKSVETKMENDVSKMSNRIQDESGMTSYDVDVTKRSSTKSSHSKAHSVGKINKRNVPVSSDKRKHQGKSKMVVRERKGEIQEEADKARKGSEERHDPAVRTSKNVGIAPVVPTNTSKRMNSVIADRHSKRQLESRNQTNQYTPQSPKLSEKTPTEIQNAPYSDGSMSAKRIESAIADVKTTARQRSPSPKAAEVKPSHKQRDVSSHLLTDVERVAKLNSIHKTKAGVFNIDKITENYNVRFEQEFKEDLHKKTQRSDTQKGENKKEASKPPSVKPSSQKSDKNLSRKQTDDTEDHEKQAGNLQEKYRMSGKTMNYFINHQTKGPINLSNLGIEEKPAVEQHKHMGRQSVPKEGKSQKCKKPRRIKDHTNKTKKDGVSNTESNSVHHSKVPNHPVTVSPRKEDSKKEDQVTGDPWDSKYFTKASEMFFKMFRDTVSCSPPKFEGSNPKTSSDQSRVFLGHSQVTEMKANPFESKQLLENDASGINAFQKTESLPDGSKTIPDTVKSENASPSALRNDKSGPKRGKMSKRCPGKINIRFEKPVDVQCKMHPEDSAKTPEICENVTFHVNTKHPSPNYKSPKDEESQKNSNSESAVNFDKLYEETTTVPIIFGAKGDKSWRSVEVGEMMREKSVNSEIAHGVVATSDKGRGDALNKVDFRVCEMHDNIRRDAQSVGHKSRHVGFKGPGVPKTATIKIPISSKTIRQVTTPYQVESIKNIDDTLKPEQSHKWERIVKVFKNIIINDIEGKRPTFLEAPSPTISTANIAKSVPTPTKPKPKMATDDTKKGTFHVKSISEHNKKRKYETAKKKPPSEPKKGHSKKHNPQKIVNYFSKRGASASSYERPKFDERSFYQSEGLMSQASVHNGQSSSSLASPSKIK